MISEVEFQMQDRCWGFRYRMVGDPKRGVSDTGWLVISKVGFQIMNGWLYQKWGFIYRMAGDLKSGLQIQDGW